MITFDDAYYQPDSDGLEYDDLEYAEYDAVCDGSYDDSVEAVEAAMLAWESR